MTAPYGFWNLYSPKESPDPLEHIFIHSLVYGITPPITGVRDCPSIRNINNIRFTVQDADTTENGRWLEWRPAAYVTEDTWDDFTLVAEAIRLKWPEIIISGDRYESFPQDASVCLIELSYDRCGFPEAVNRHSESFLAVPARTRNKDIFGRFWYFSPLKCSISIRFLAFILRLTTLGHDIEPREIGYCSAAFVIRYAGIWPSTSWTRWCCLSARVCHLQFHIRFFSTAKSPSAHDLSEGLFLFRKMGQLSSTRKDKHIERRTAIAMNTTLDSNPAYYSMVTLTDCRTNLLDHVGEIHGIKTTPNERFTGITVFQIAIMNLLDEGNRQWADFLHSVETDLYELQKLHSALADLYTAEDWIRETVRDLERLAEDLSISTQHIAPDVVQQNWETLIQYQRDVQAQMKEKAEGIKALIDDWIVTSRLELVATLVSIVVATLVSIVVVTLVSIVVFLVATLTTRGV